MDVSLHGILVALHRDVLGLAILLREQGHNTDVEGIADRIVTLENRMGKPAGTPPEPTDPAATTDATGFRTDEPVVQVPPSNPPAPAARNATRAEQAAADAETDQAQDKADDAAEKADAPAFSRRQPEAAPTDTGAADGPGAE